MQPAHLHRVQGNGARLVLDVYNVLKQIRAALVLWVSFMGLLHAIHRSWCLGWGLVDGEKKQHKANQNKPQKIRGIVVSGSF